MAPGDGVDGVGGVDMTRVRAVCPDCRGSGCQFVGGDVDCYTCGGRGLVSLPDPYVCPNCGIADDAGQPCERCGIVVAPNPAYLAAVEAETAMPEGED